MISALRQKFGQHCITLTWKDTQCGDRAVDHVCIQIRICHHLGRFKDLLRRCERGNLSWLTNSMKLTFEKGTHKLGTILMICHPFSTWSVFSVHCTKIIEVLVEQLDLCPYKFQAGLWVIQFFKVGNEISLNVVSVAKWIVLISLALLPKSIGVEFLIFRNQIIKRCIRILEIFNLIFFIL